VRDGSGGISFAVTVEIKLSCFEFALGIQLGWRQVLVDSTVVIEFVLASRSTRRALCVFDFKLVFSISLICSRCSEALALHPRPLCGRSHPIDDRQGALPLIKNPSPAHGGPGDLQDQQEESVRCCLSL